MNTKPENIDEDDLKIEIVDDTPEEDRGRPMAPESTENDDDIAVNDDEIANYRDEWKKRLKEISFKTHAERRAKEYAAKQRDEALAIIENLRNENNKFRELAGSTEKFAAEQAKARTETDINATQRGMKEAFEAGDTEKFVELTAKLNRLITENERYTNYEPAQYKETVYEVPKPQAPPQPDKKVLEWANQNTWFEGSGELENEMTVYAYGVSDILIKQHKIDPRSDKYFEELNTRIQRRFPEYFKKSEPEVDATAQTRPVVAPATRNASTTRVVRLTPSQVALAKRLGLTPEAYAAQYKKDYGHG